MCKGKYSPLVLHTHAQSGPDIHSIVLHKHLHPSFVTYNSGPLYTRTPWFCHTHSHVFHTHAHPNLVTCETRAFSSLDDVPMQVSRSGGCTRRKSPLGVQGMCTDSLLRHARTHTSSARPKSRNFSRRPPQSFLSWHP